MAEAFDALQARRHRTSTRCACARSRSAPRSTDFIADARDGVRGRAEPRRAAAHDAGQRAGDRSGPARADPALRRHADHRALHHRGDRRARARRQRRADREDARKGLPHDLSRQAQAAPPDPAEQQARLHAARLRRQDLDAVRRLRPRLDLGRAGAGLLGARHRAAPRRQAVGHRLLVEDARLLPRRLARLQHRARPDAVGADRRQPRQPRAALPRRQRRRRLGVDRPRPVRARHAARRQHDLHRREQRRLRPDQGPVLGDRRPGQQEQEGRDQQRHRDRPRRDGAAARRELRRRAASRATRSSSCR